MSNLPELTPYLAEALRKFRAGYREHSAELADAFAALYPETELPDGAYWCDWITNGDMALLVVTRSGSTNTIIRLDTGNRFVTSNRDEYVTNIRRIDDCPKCAAFREWAAEFHAKLLEQP